MQIRIKNKLIVEPVSNILETVRKELTNGKLKDIEKERGGNIFISCPCHKDGLERHASCMVSTATDTDLEPGFAHCFTCGYNAPITKLIGDLFDETEEFGAEWLVERFGSVFIQQSEYIPEITPYKPKLEEKQYLDESVLIPFDFYHPYMWKRNLSKSVVDEFRVGYDKERDAITFPVYDEKHRLVMVTARSVNSKRFYIPEGVDKPVYLLYDILQRNVKTVVVAESQINALTLRTWGYDSIALFGTGSSKQFETLRKSGIRNYILAYDGDEAGRKGAFRFKHNMPKDVMITDLRLPAGKDVNDLTKEQFETLLKNS